MEEANFALPANKKLNHVAPPPRFSSPKLGKKKKRRGGSQNPENLVSPKNAGFCGTGEAEKDLSGASRYRAMPICDRVWGQGSDSKYERVGHVLELTGALGGAGAWGARRLGRDPRAQYLLQK